MTDQFDRATEIEEMHRDIALTFRNPTLPACGVCHFCTEIVEGNKLFCNADCRNDWQKDKDRKKREGKL
jgi:hypothetical protein